MQITPFSLAGSSLRPAFPQPTPVQIALLFARTVIIHKQAMVLEQIAPRRFLDAIMVHTLPVLLQVMAIPPALWHQRGCN